jgi:hypothetical protein
MRERKEKAWTDLEIFFGKAAQVVCCVMILEAAGDECSRSVSSSPESTEEDKADRADQPENLEEGSLSCLIQDASFHFETYERSYTSTCKPPLNDARGLRKRT